MIPVSKPSTSMLDIKGVANTILEEQLSMRELVTLFEKRVAEYIGVKHAVACTSGTTALHLALMSLRIGQGDEVIIPDMTFVATANAVSYTGAKPVLVDVDPLTWCIDVEKVNDAVTPKTKAIIPVHLYGQPANMPDIKAIAQKHGLYVIEDACEAMGASIENDAEKTMVGAIGDCGVFSFYANKLITSGEGGMVTTNRDDIAQRARKLLGHAMTEERYYHDEIGYNYRMTEMQGALGASQMLAVDKKLVRQIHNWNKYRINLEEFAVFQFSPDGTNSSKWMPAMLLGVPAKRVIERMFVSNVDTRPFFVPLHRLPMYKDDDKRFTISNDLHTRGLCLPSWFDLSYEKTFTIMKKFRRIVQDEQKAAIENEA